MQEQRFQIDRDGVRIAGVDFGGEGPPTLLLHGLAGHAGEWRQTASWLTQTHRVVAVDSRGAGRSERSPRDVSLAAHAADAAAVADALDLAGLAVVGQSFGGQVAMTLAAARPDLVRALVVAEASPEGGWSDAGIDGRVDEVERWLASWPVPFASRSVALEFFGGPSLFATAWSDGLEERADGLHPGFDRAVMTRTLRDACRHAYWDLWERLTMPVLVVTGGRGQLSPDQGEALAARAPDGRHTAIADAGHDLHLDAPAEWRAALERFLTAGGAPSANKRS